MTRPSTGAAQAMGWRAVQLAGSQAIYFVRLLVLARLLAPEAFGLLAIAMVALSVLMRVSNMGMLPALIRKPDATERESNAAWTVGVLRAAAVAAVLIVAAPAVARLFGEPGAAAIVQVMALRPLLEASASIGVARLTRELQFRRLAVIQLPGAVADTVIAIVAAPAFGVWALVGGSLAGVTTSTILSYFLAPHRPRFEVDRAVAAPLIGFGRWVLLSGIIALAGTSTVQLIVSRQIGVAGLGLYFLAIKLAFLPADLASSVLGAVAFPLYAGQRQETSFAAFRGFFTGAVLVLLPVYAVVIVLAPELSTVLGARWAGTAPAVQLLAAACVVGMIGESLDPLLMARGKPNIVTLFLVVQTAVILICAWPLVARFGAAGAALAWLIGNSATQVFAVAWARNQMPGLFDGSGRRLWAATGAAAVAAASAAIVIQRLPGTAGAILAIGASMIAATLWLWWRDRRSALGLHELLPVIRKSPRNTVPATAPWSAYREEIP